MMFNKIELQMHNEPPRQITGNSEEELKLCCWEGKFCTKHMGTNIYSFNGEIG